ncbi:MAG: chemotaxis protein CheD [Planctomycetes bacterium]|nr:chemotaxis protein CheD [Planctomycetota bacterium]
MVLNRTNNGTVMLGIGDYGAAKESGQVVKTLALGSCVALLMLDPHTHIVGMAHVALPESSISPDRAKDKPGHFADTAVPALLKAMADLGGNPNGKGYIVKLVGGARVMDPNSTFSIGKRNVLALKKALWKYGLGPRAEDVGGSISRTVEVDVDMGRVVITSAKREQWEI